MRVNCSSTYPGMRATAAVSMSRWDRPAVSGRLRLNGVTGSRSAEKLTWSYRWGIHASYGAAAVAETHHRNARCGVRNDELNGVARGDLGNGIIGILSCIVLGAGITCCVVWMSWEGA